jgi:hypothetical protein
MYSNRTLDSNPENDSHNNQTDQIAEPPSAPAQRNPRWFLLSDPDTFFNDLLMEQDEQ